MGKLCLSMQGLTVYDYRQRKLLLIRQRHQDRSRMRRSCCCTWQGLRSSLGWAQRPPVLCFRRRWAELGLLQQSKDFEAAWDGPNDHQYCVFADDGRSLVYFNKARTSKQPGMGPTTTSTVFSQTMGGAWSTSTKQGLRSSLGWAQRPPVLCFRRRWAEL